MATYRFAQRFMSFTSVVLLLSLAVQMTVSDAAAGASHSLSSSSAAGRSRPANAQPQIVSPRLELVGQFGGTLTAFAVNGEWAYGGIGPRMKVFDISDPADLRIVGETAVLPAMLVDLAASGRYVYAAMRDYGIRVFDVVDPAAPVEVGSFFQADLKIRALAIEGNYIYVTHDAGLSILDISDPLAPAPLGAMALPAPDGGRELVVMDQIVYVAAYRGGIRIVDASDPAAPVEIGSLPTAAPAQDLAVAPPYIYAVTDRALVTINAADLAAPVQLGSYPISDLTSGFLPPNVAVAGRYVYVTATAALLAFDVANPALPVQISATPLIQKPIDLIVDDRFIYAAGKSSIQQFSSPLPAPASPFGFFASPDAMDAIAIESSYATIADQTGLQILDISNSLAPVQIGHYPMAAGAQDVTVATSLAYVIDRSQHGLHILDLANPATPVELSYFELPSSILYLQVVDSWVFLVDVHKLHVLDVSIPQQPVELASVATSSSNREMDIAGGYAYIATINGISIVDIKNPKLPVLAASYPLMGGADGMLVADGYAFVRSISGVHILDLANPIAPHELGVVEANIPHLAVAGSHLYLDGYDRLDMFDISDPSAPVYVSSYQPANLRVRDLVLARNQIFLAATSGLFIADLNALIAPPVEVGRRLLPLSRVTDITVAGDFVYTTDELRLLSIFDVADPTAPTEVGHVDRTYPDWYSDNDIEVANGYAYVVNNGLLHVFNITDPAQPVGITRPLTISYVTDVAIAGDYAYAVGDFYDMVHVVGLYSIDIKDPERPELVDGIPLPWAADEFRSRTVALSGDYAYVGGAFYHWRTRYSGNLAVVDVANPAQLAVTGVTEPGATWGVAVDGSYAYAVASRNYFEHYERLFVVDVRNPALPRPVGWADISGAYWSNIVVARQRAYFTSPSGLTIFDIRRTQAPVPLFTDPLMGWPTRAAVDGEYVYVATEAAGFFIYRYVEPPALPQSWLPLMLRR